MKDAGWQIKDECLMFNGLRVKVYLLPAFAVRAPNGKSCALTSFDVRCSSWRSLRLWRYKQLVYLSTRLLIYLSTSPSFSFVFLYLRKSVHLHKKRVTSWCIICLPLCRCRADMMQMKDIMRCLATVPILRFVRRLASSLMLCFSLFTMC